MKTLKKYKNLLRYYQSISGRIYERHRWDQNCGKINLLLELIQDLENKKCK